MEKIVENEQIDIENCENCGQWRQFNETTGFCLDGNNWHDETLYDSWCGEWKRKE